MSPSALRWRLSAELELRNSEKSPKESSTAERTEDRKEFVFAHSRTHDQRVFLLDIRRRLLSRAQVVEIVVPESVYFSNDSG
jgi:hypothetical protein